MLDRNSTDQNVSNADSTVVSDAKIAANQRNAQNSTGPTTGEGKARSSQNATRHGLLAKRMKLTDEEQEAYNQFCAAYVADLKPAGPVETELAQICADTTYRLQVAAAIQHQFMSDFDAVIENPQKLTTFSIYEQRLTRTLNQNLKQLREMQDNRRALETQQLEQMRRITNRFLPEAAEEMDPATLGFVCSKQQWLNYWYAAALASDRDHPHLKWEDRSGFYSGLARKTIFRDSDD